MEALNMQKIADSLGDHEWVYKKYIPRGCVSILAAKGGVGKSGFALHIAATIARENGFKTLYVDYEQTTRHMSERWRSWKLSDVQELILVPVEQNHLGEYESVKPTFTELYDMGKENNIDLMVIDSMTSLYANYDIEARRGASALINELRGISVSLNCGLLLLTHTNKAVVDMSQISIDSVSGSAAVVDMSRSVIFLVADPNDDEKKTAYHLKHNYTNKMPNIQFRLTSGGVIDMFESPEDRPIKLIAGTKIEKVIQDMRDGIASGLETKKELRKYVIELGASQMEATRAYKSLVEDN